MPDLAVTLEPLDPLLFGDNRSGGLADQDPSPATFYGAIGGRLAAALGARGEADWEKAAPVLGPFEPRLDRPSEKRAALLGYTLADSEGRAWFPRPLHFRLEVSGRDLFPQPLLRPARTAALSSLPAGALPLTAPAGKRAVEEWEEDLWLDEGLLGEILVGAPPTEGSLRAYLRERQDFYLPEPRPGLAMRNATQTVAPGRLFTRPYRRFRRSAQGSRSAGFHAWYRVPALGGRSPESFDGTGFLGGDRRRARFTFREEEAPLASLRREVQAAAAEAEGWLAYLLTPGVAPARGLDIDGQAPLASALGRAQPVSGWSASARETGPRPVLTLLPAGSVFFFAWPQGKESPDARAQLLEDRWLSPLTSAHANSGFGRILTGVWRR